MLHNPTIGMRVRYIPASERMNPPFNDEPGTVIDIHTSHFGAEWNRIAIEFDQIVYGKRVWNSSVKEYNPLFRKPAEEAAHLYREAKRKEVEAMLRTKEEDDRRRQAHAMKYL